MGRGRAGGGVWPQHCGPTGTVVAKQRLESRFPRVVPGRGGGHALPGRRTSRRGVAGAALHERPALSTLRLQDTAGSWPSGGRSVGDPGPAPRGSASAPPAVASGSLDRGPRAPSRPSPLGRPDRLGPSGPLSPLCVRASGLQGGEGPTPAPRELP